MSCGLVAIHACYLRVILVWVIAQGKHPEGCLHVHFSSVPKESNKFIVYWWVLRLCVLEVAVVCLFFLAVGRIAPAFGWID